MRGIEGRITKMLNIVQHSIVGTVIFYIRTEVEFQHSFQENYTFNGF